MPNTRSNNNVVVLMLVVFMILDISRAQANEQDKRVEEQARVAIDAAPSRTRESWSSRVGVQYGGWLNYRFNDYNDSDNDRRLKDALNTSSIVDARYWLKFSLKPSDGSTHKHFMYVRFKEHYVNRTGTAPGNRYDINGPHVDYAYTLLDYHPLWIEAGRRYFNVGKGIVYSNIHDGIQLNYRVPGFNAGLFGAKTKPFESNIDTSVPGYDKESERYFYGVGLGYTGFRDQSLYGFYLAQHDFSDTHMDNLDHHFTYQSQYVGVGSKGNVIPSLEYWVELIKESGISRIYTSDERKTVNAWATDVEFIYGPSVVAKPRLSVEYAFGSGDQDRVSVTDTRYGNVRGQDKSFLYFGYAPTGFALAPRLSNLHLIRVGLELNPFEVVDGLKDMTWGINFYRFYKDRGVGGISDYEATANSKDIGREVDLYLDWRILSDLTLAIEYGHFMPGDAYAESAHAAENFFSLSVTHTF